MLYHKISSRLWEGKNSARGQDAATSSWQVEGVGVG